MRERIDQGTTEVVLHHIVIQIAEGFSGAEAAINYLKENMMTQKGHLSKAWVASCGGMT